MGMMRSAYGKVRHGWGRLRFYASVNWVKTVYFNFHFFPTKMAMKLPVVFYGRVSFGNLDGSVAIEGPISRGMIGIGQHFETTRRSKGTTVVTIMGRLVFKGSAHMGRDILLYVGSGAYCEFGHMVGLGSDVRLICTNKVILGDWARIAYESQLIDTTVHPMRNTQTGELYPFSRPVVIGSHNSISNRVSLMPGTVTPDRVVVASNSVCNKDYSAWGSDILMGGIPAKLIRKNYARDWEGEKPLLVRYTKVW
jgi:acetyltransferase-like isoleucine patch superfamily enzyme